MSSLKKTASILLLIFLIGCFPQQLAVDDELQTETPALDESLSTATFTPPSTPTIVPVTETLALPQPSVTITAKSGNLFIRRGPSTKYSRIGVLTKGMSAEIIGKDVLSKWVQIKIPDSKSTGWVSIQTQFSEITGDLKQIPDFTFTDFPLPAYIKNCTEHELWIEPGGYYLYSLFTNAQSLNEVRVDSGVYYVYDLSVPDEPLIKKIDLQENQTAYITVNGLGESHKCP